MNLYIFIYELIHIFFTIILCSVCCREFGTKVLHIKPILNKLQLILEYRDKNVRSEAKLLTVELYSSIGPTRIKAILTNLKPLQVPIYF